MVKLTGVAKQFAHQEMRVGKMTVDGVSFWPQNTLGTNIYVDSTNGAATNSGLSPGGALSTLDAAFAVATANKGDVIWVMPNHAETITGAGGIAHDVAGVSVIGLGVGDQRPRFLMDASADVTYAITAADAYLENLVFAAGHADVVACITTTKKNTWINRCEFVDNTADENFLTEIKATSTTDNDSDGLKVTECRFITPDANAVECIEINADIAFSKTGFHPPILINDDKIYQVVNGAGTGTIQWDLYYIPMEAGARITASA